MASFNLLLLPGDGIGPEVMAEVGRVIEWLDKNSGATFETESDLVGGSAYDAHGQSISDAAMDKADAADAVIFGAVGGPKWDSVPYEVRPEAGLLRLRKDLQLFANLRPAICYPALADASSLKPEVVEGLDILILRELTGGVYFGEPKEIVTLENGEKRAVDTQLYTTHEIERIARAAFELARARNNKVTSMEKRNVMRSGVLWNEVVTAVHKAEYDDVELEHMLADAGVSERASYIGGSFFDSVAPGADCLVLKFILHDWDDAECAAILANCRAAMAKDTDLLIVERIMPEIVQPENEDVVRQDMVMMPINGKERTLAEMEKLGTDAGFALIDVKPLIEGCSLIAMRAV